MQVRLGVEVVFRLSVGCAGPVMGWWIGWWCVGSARRLVMALRVFLRRAGVGLSGGGWLSGGGAGFGVRGGSVSDLSDFLRVFGVRRRAFGVCLFRFGGGV